MKERLRKLLVSKSRKYAFFGALVGLGFFFAISFLEIGLMGQPATLDSFLQLQSTHRIFWLFDIVPFLLGYLGYRIGRREEALDEINRFVATAGESGIDALVEQKLYYEALLKNVPIAVVSLDLEHNITAANPAFEQLFGYQQEELKDRKLDPLITAVDDYSEAKGFTEEVARGNKIEAVAIRRRKDGSLVEVEIKAVPIMAEDRQIGVIGIYDNLSEQKRQEQTLKGSLSRMEELATIDPLTQLLNRRAITEYIQQEFNRAQEAGGTLGLAMVDLDHLKEINDVHGHLAGDEALKAIGKTLERSCRAKDKVARWGGDEFLIVLPDIDTENATRIGQRIIQNANQQILKFGETENKLSISIGMTSVAHGNGSRVVIEDVFRETDRLLYEAKNAGRNRLCYSPMKIKK